MHIIIPMEQIVEWNNTEGTNANWQACNVLHKLGCPAVRKIEGVFAIEGDLEQYTDQHHAVHFVWPEPQVQMEPETADALAKAAAMPLNMNKDFISLGAGQCPECGKHKLEIHKRCDACQFFKWGGEGWEQNDMGTWDNYKTDPQKIGYDIPE